VLTNVHRLLKLSIVGAAAAVILAGCGSASSSATHSAASGGNGAATTSAATAAAHAVKPEIAYLTQGYVNYYVTSANAATRAAKAFGGTVHVLQANYSPTTQATQCQDAISSRRYNAFLIYPVSGPGMVGCTKAAIAAGIKVVALESPIGPKFTITPQVPGITGSVFFPEPADAQASFQMVKAACSGKDPCNVVYLIGCASCSYDTAKVAAIMPLFATVPSIHIVAREATNYTTDGGLSATQNIIQAHPDINVIFAHDDNSIIGAQKALQGTPLQGKVALIGSGASCVGVDRIKDGQWYGSKVALPQTNATVAVKMIEEALKGEKSFQREYSVPAMSPVGGAVTRQNVAKFTAQWGC
jgi:ribose transport system substrate-binding protein